MKKLKEYNTKRDFSKTKEPAGKLKAKRRKDSTKRSESLEFVIHKHAASRLHYDFRIEFEGVLVSWAVPKGPSLNPTEKHFAVKVEDHPFNYKNFEGIIPKGEYGAGEVIIWDKGKYYPIDDGKPVYDNIKKMEKVIKKGLNGGKLSIVLNGTKLHGIFTLVRFQNSDKDWLLIKKKDEFAETKKDIAREDESVISGLSILDLQKLPNSPHRIHAGRSVMHKLKGKATTKLPAQIHPMLAYLTDEAFTKEGWIYEPKFDGIRAIAFIQNGKVKLQSRRGLDITERYPNLEKKLAKHEDDIIIDGEIVALDEEGRPSFSILQQRSGLSKHIDVVKAEKSIPIKYYVFDILYKNGDKLLSLPLNERKQILKKTVQENSTVKYVDDLHTTGEEALAVCIDNGMEGIVAKRLDSQYDLGHRSKNWLKVKVTQNAEFVICGYTQGTGSRAKTFGALVLGYYPPRSKKLSFAGLVGTGFTDEVQKMLLKRLKPLEQKACPFDDKNNCKEKATWVKPQLIAQIKYAEWTPDKKLRIPVFQALREDILPQETGPNPTVEVEEIKPGKKKPKTKLAKKILVSETRNVQKSKSAKTIESTQISLDPKKKKTDKLISDIVEELENAGDSFKLEVENYTIEFSSLDKPFWPKHGKTTAVTKRDYAIYLAKTAPYIAPHLQDRTLTFIRYPHGIEGEKFFQKHWTHKLPPFVESVKHFTEHENKDLEYVMCNNLATLLWLAQIASLELHVTHTRVNPEPDGEDLSKKFTGSLKNISNSLLNYPDYLVLDLDPYLYSGKEAKNAEPELNKKGFRKVCDVALWLKEMLDNLSVESFIKTSGKTGLHIYIPIVRNISYDAVRDMAGTIGKYLMEKHPKDVTMSWAVVKRKGMIFFDHNMNARGKTLASPYSPRNAIEASVSTPLEWDEIGSIYPTDLTIYTVPKRLAKIGDPWRDILKHKNDIYNLLTASSSSKRMKAFGPHTVQVNEDPNTD